MRLRDLFDSRMSALGSDLELPWLAEKSWHAKLATAYLHRDRVRLEQLVFGWGSAVSECSVENGVGVISISGPMVEGRYWTDYTDVRTAVDEYARDRSVHAILLAIDSPGGQAVPALHELASRIREVRAEKPVIALANAQATSAAYVIASAASEVYAAGPSATIGSLGAVITHFEESGWLARVGIGITEIASGKHKTDLSPNKPLNADGRAFLERLVEVAFVELIASVTAGRSITEAEIREQEAAIYLGAEAVEAKLADGVRTRAEIIDDLVARRQRSIFGSLGGPQGAAGAAAAATLATQPAAEDTGMSQDQGTPSPAPSAPGAGAPAQAAAAPTPAAAPANVVELDAARAETERIQLERAHEINSMCKLAGCPDRAGDFIADPKMTAKAVSDLLVREKADASAREVDGHHARAQGTQRQIDTQAIYKRWNADARGASLGGR